MNWRDVQSGTTVYHSLNTHCGKGVVQRIVFVDSLTALFESGTTRRILVIFDNDDSPVRVRLQELRKTPNRKKIRDMVAMYRKRGVNAQDGGDRLIIPKPTTPVTKEP